MACLTGSVRSYSSYATYLSVSIPRGLISKKSEGTEGRDLGQTYAKGERKDACGHIGVRGKRVDKEAFENLRRAVGWQRRWQKRKCGRVRHMVKKRSIDSYDREPEKALKCRLLLRLHKPFL